MVIIVYFKTMEWIGYSYEMARRLLGKDFLVAEQNPRVMMFHSSMDKDSGKLKKMILESLSRPQEECHIRLIFSSVALGMGADLKHVTRVIHAGPPANLETYVQEIGRAGRSGLRAEAVLYFHKGDIAVKSMRQEREYCVNTARCRRSVINGYVGFKSHTKPAVCCDICDSSLGLQWDFAISDISKE